MKPAGNMDSLLRRLVDDGLRPGCAALVMHRGRLVYAGQFGYADIDRRRPIRPDTIYRLFSMTKPVTAVAALILLERGLFRLNDPVSGFLPDFAHCKVLHQLPDGEVDLRPAVSPILIRDLLCMTSGIPYEDAITPSGQKMRAAMSKLHRRKDHEPLVDLQALAAAVARVPLAFDPGTRWLYGMSHDILGALVEVVSGQRFSDFLQAEIFDPLQMSETGFRMRAGWNDRLATLYTAREPGRFTAVKDRLFKEPDDILEFGGAGLLGTLGDYARFACMLQQGGTLDGQRILGRQTVAMLTRNHLTARQMPDYDWPQLAGYGYGLGVRVLQDPAAAGVTSQAGEYGWGGMAGTWFFVDPQAELVGIYGQQLVPSGEVVHAPLFLNVAGSLI